MEPGLSGLKQLKSKNRLKRGDRSALLENYSRYNLEFINGKGQYLYDEEGKEYLDFLSGIAVTSFGHNNSYISQAVKEQLDSYWHVSNLFESTHQETLAAKLVEASGLAKVFFSNSGTEANEAAIKFARKWGQSKPLTPNNHKSVIVTALGGFHGRTMGSLSASGQYKLWEGFFPLTPGFAYVPFDNIKAVEYSIDQNTLAIMVEPVQGESGVIIPTEGYLKELRDICDRNNMLLILDEVQTGLGRTGKMFAYQWEEIKPDIVTVAKGIANGLPLGAVICSSEIGDSITTGSHGSTFGGNPVSVAAAIKVLNLLTQDRLNHIETTGIKLKEEIGLIGSSLIKDIRGKGLMIGIEFIDGVNAKNLALELLGNGIIVGTSGEKIIRLLPPFIITNNDIEYFKNTLSKTLNNY